MVGLLLGVAEKDAYITIGKLRHADDTSVIRYQAGVIQPAVRSAKLTQHENVIEGTLELSPKNALEAILGDTQRKSRLLTKDEKNLTKKEAAVIKYEFWLEYPLPEEVLGTKTLGLET